MKPIIQINKLSKTYLLGEHKVEALSEVSLNIHAGEFVILSGPSGSGKSTLLQLIGCLDTPTAGDVTVLDLNVNKASDRVMSNFRARSLGFVFQNFNLIPVLNVYENVEYSLLLGKRSYQKKDITDVIEQVGLGKFSHHKPNALSGGQRQRVAIARALVHKPNVLIADEPTANLDAKTSSEVLSLMTELALENNTTVVMSSHDPSLIEKSDVRQIKLVDGKLVGDEPRALSNVI